MTILSNTQLNIQKLLIKLDKQFPHRPVTPKDKVEDIMYRAGQESVLSWLRSQLDANVSPQDIIRGE